MAGVKGWKQADIDAENARVRANREARRRRAEERRLRSESFRSRIDTDWKVPDGERRTRNQLFGIIMQEAGPRDRTLDDYTILSQRHVASAMHNYARHHGLTMQELIEGRGRLGGPAYLASIPPLTEGTAKGNPYDWGNDRIDYDAVAIDSRTTRHAENAMRLAARMVNGTLNPMTDAMHFKNLAPGETWDGMIPVKMDTKGVTVPTSRVLKLYNDPREVRQAVKASDAGSPTNRVSSAPGTAPAQTYDTPIPDALRPAYERWYAQLPKNLQYTGDYDLQGAWLERLGRPEKYEVTQNGHLDDYGKKPNHPTFSSGSKWHDPKVPERTGGEWKRADDGSWDFYPGSGNRLTDEQLAEYFRKYEKGSRVHPRNVRQAAKAGDAGSSPSTGAPKGSNPALDGYAGPRIVINPSTFRNEKDGLCVAFDEAFRILMEVNGFDPVAEPTEKQRKFFSDTAYADDERMMRRTILARICTFDTSVTDPTDEQLQEAVEFLDTVMEIGAPQSEWEQSAVQRIRDTIAKSVGQPRAGETPEPPAPEDGTENSAAGGGDSRLVRAAEGAGTANDEEEKRKAQASETVSPAAEPTAQESGEPAARPPERDDMNQAPHPTQDYNKEGMTERGVGYVTDSSGQVIGVNGLTDPNKGVASDSEIQHGISIIPVKTASPSRGKPNVFEIANRSDLEGNALSAAMKKTGAYTTVAGTWMDKTGKPIGDEASANQYLKALDLLKGTGASYDHGGFRTGGKVQGLLIGNDLKSVIDYVENYGKKDGRYYDGNGVWRTKDRVVSRFAGQPAAQEPGEAQPVQPNRPSQPNRPAQPAVNRRLTRGEAEWQERYNAAKNGNQTVAFRKNASETAWQERYNAAKNGNQTVAFRKNASETAWQERYEQARRNSQDRRAVVASGKRIKARRIDGTVEYDDGTIEKA